MIVPSHRKMLPFLLLIPAALVGILAWRAGGKLGSGAARVEVTRAVKGPDLRADLPGWARDPGGERGSIAGSVRSAGGGPVADALVALLPEVGMGGGDPRFRPAARVRSGADGRFRIEGILPGEYGLTATVAGQVGAHRGGLAVLPGGQLSGIDLVLEGGGVLLGGTVSDAGGGIIAGAEVRVTSQATGGSATRTFLATADASGRYQITVPRQQHLVVADADGYAPDSRLVDTTAAARADFALRPAARLAGKVIDRGDRAPVGGAQVLLHDPEVWWRPTLEATTDARGAFELRDLHPGSFRISAHRGTLVSVPRPVEVADADRASEVILEVQAGRSIAGRTLVRGQPLAGARIRVRQSTLALPGSVRALSDGAGGYRIEGLLPGRYEVSAEAPGHAPAAREVVLTREADRGDADLELGAEAVLHGTVSRPDGTPAAGATVTASVGEVTAATGSLAGRQAVDRTDAGGRFRLRALAAGKVEVVATDPDTGRVSWGPEPLAAGETREIALTLVAGALVIGLVKYDDGEPAAGVTVLAVAPATQAMAQVRTDPQGRFELGPLAPGQTLIKASRKEGLAGMLDFKPEGREQKVITLEGTKPHKGIELVILRGGRTLSGLVVDPDGRPLAGATVSADPAGTEAGVREAFGAMLGQKGLATGEDGRFELTNLEKGPYTVIARHSSFPEGRLDKVPDGAREVRLQLPRAAVLAGVVVGEGGVPVTDFSIQAVESEAGAPGRRPGGATSSLARMMGGGAPPVHDPGGAFEVGGLAAGTYDVVVTTADGMSGQVPGLTLAAGERKAGLRVALGRGLKLLGQIASFPEGDPLAGVPVLLFDHQMTMRTADARGHFAMEGLLGGRKVRLMYGARMPGFVADTAEIDLPAGGTELDLGTLKLVRGTAQPERSASQVGLTVSFENRRPHVRHVVARGPAEQAGIKAGDRLLAIDGKPTDGLGRGGLEFLLGGDPGTILKLTVATAAQPPRPLELTRR